LRKHENKKNDVVEKEAVTDQVVVFDAPGTNPSFNPCGEGLSLHPYYSTNTLFEAGYFDGVMDLTCGHFAAFAYQGMVSPGTHDTHTKDSFEENCECVDPTVGTTSPAPTPMPKSGKVPSDHHGEECDLDVLQRAKMFANYMFQLIDENQDNQVTPDEFGTWSAAEGKIAEDELAAVKAIGGTTIAFSLKQLAAGVEEYGSEPINLVEFEAAVILHYCNNDQSAFFSLVERKTGLHGGEREIKLC
jgi:hypothetical protein